MKSAAIAMQNAVLLQQEVHQLYASNPATKREEIKKRISQAFIQDGGSLTDEDGL